jgi:hypothetical protein
MPFSQKKYRSSALTVLKKGFARVMVKLFVGSVGISLSLEFNTSVVDFNTISTLVIVFVLEKVRPSFPLNFETFINTISQAFGD